MFKIYCVFLICGSKKIIKVGIRFSLLNYGFIIKTKNTHKNEYFGQSKNITSMSLGMGLFTKGLEIQRLIGSAVAGFNHARTIPKDSDKGLEARQDD